MYVLDTDHISLLESDSGNQAAHRLRFRLARLKPNERVTTIITFEEQMRGWMACLAQTRSPMQQVAIYRRLMGVLDRYTKIPILEFDESAAKEFQRLKQARIRIGTMDLKIAAIALTRGAIVLTRNISDFGQVPGLRFEDWTA